MSAGNKGQIQWLVRPGEPGERDTILDLVEASFGAKSLRRVAKFEALTEQGLMFVVVDPADPGHIAGAYARFPLTLSLPGNSAAASAENPAKSHVTNIDGITWVVVRPDARRQGILRTIMKHHSEDAISRGIPWAMLGVTEDSIYGRFGYASASRTAWLTLPKGSLDTVSNPWRSKYRYKLLSATDEAVQQHYDLWRVTMDDSIGTPRWTTKTMSVAYAKPTPPDSDSLDPKIAVLEEDGKLVAAALVTRTAAWSDGKPSGSVNVSMLVAESTEAKVAMAHYLTSFDLFSNTTFAYINPDELLVYAGGGPGKVDLSIKKGLWLRPTMPAEALVSRGYAKPIDMVLQLTDPTLDQDHTLRLTTDGQSFVRCEPTTDGPDLSCPVTTISQLILGEIAPQNFSEGAQLGVFDAQEHTPGALLELAEAMQTPQQVHNLVMF